VSIKNITLEKNFLALAPMAGLTHAALRELVASFGGCDLFFTEMLNVRAIVHQNPENDPYLICGKNDRPLVAQLVGREPELFARAVARLEKGFSFYGYDINFGCSRGAIQRYGWGVSLMKEPALCAEIVAAVRSATQKPVSAKIRSGFEHNREKLISFVETLIQAGVQLVTLHPRTAEEGFRRPARWEEISWLKENFPSLKILGNGDVFGPQDAQKMLAQTRCHGVMIGRAALLRPWIFRDTKSYLAKGGIPPGPSPQEIPTKMWELISQYLPEELREKRFELWLFWFLQNFPFGLHYFGEVKKEKNLAAKLEKLRQFLSRERLRPYPARPYLLR